MGAAISAGRMRIGFLGDSHGQVLQRLITKRLPLAVAVSHPGWSEAKWAASGDLARFRSADMVIVQLGGNNRQFGGAYEDTIAKLISRISGRVLWIGPSTVAASATGDVGAWHERTAAAQKRYLVSRGVPWFDSRAVTATGQRADGVHFTRAGYTRWADAAGAWVEGQVAGGGSVKVKAGFALPLVAAAVVVMWLWQRRAAVAAAGR